MAADLIFYTNPISRGRIIRWMLEEVGAPYDTVVLDYASTMKAEPYLSVNPMGKVPAIVHKGKVVFVCVVFCVFFVVVFFVVLFVAVVFVDVVVVVVVAVAVVVADTRMVSE